MRINLHSHSTVSDGALVPKKLAEKMCENKVELWALTDHDKIDGLEEASIRSNELGIRFINGIEFSVKTSNFEIDFLNPLINTLHILVLNFNLSAAKKFFQEMNNKKQERLDKLINKLIEEGYLIDGSLEYSNKTSIAEQVVSKGYASTVQDAFNNIINGFYDRYQDFITIDTLLEFKAKCGGKIIWAHPYEIFENVSKKSIDESEIEIIANRLKSLGVDGIEVYYEKYSESQIMFLKSLQEKLSFITSAGTDYHAKDSQPVIFIEIDEKKVEGVLE